MEHSWIFFANDVYASVDGILFAIFDGLYGEFTTGLKVMMNALFHLFIIAYAILAIRSGIIASIFALARTIFLLLLTFNLSFNISTFKFWAYDLIMTLPTKAATFFVGTTISSLIPNFKPLESFDTSDVFNKLFLILVNRADATKSGMLDLPSFPGLYLYFVAFMVVLLYFMFWLIQFNFLIQASVYMIIGIPVIVLASFKQTQSVFFEWLRAVVTLMLYPLIAAIVIFLIINLLMPLTEDAVHIVAEEHMTGSAIGKTFVVLIFGIYTLKQVPHMAAVLTRGHMTTGNPVSFAGSAVKTVGSALNSARTSVGTAAGAVAAYNASAGEKQKPKSSADGAAKQSGFSPRLLTAPSGSIQQPPATVSPAGSKGASGSTQPRSGSLNPAGASAGGFANVYQSAPQNSLPAISPPASKPAGRPSGKDVSVKAQSVSDAEPKQPVGHYPSSQPADVRQPQAAVSGGGEPYSAGSVFSNQYGDHSTQQFSANEQQTHLQQVSADQSSHSNAGSETISQVDQSNLTQSKSLNQSRNISQSDSHYQHQISNTERPQQPPASFQPAADPSLQPSQQPVSKQSVQSVQPPPKTAPSAPAAVGSVSGSAAAPPLKKGPSIFPDDPPLPPQAPGGQGNNNLQGERRDPKIDTKT